MKSDKLRGTFLIEFKDGDKMIFGNNYKPWWMHAREYVYRYFGNREAGWRYQDVVGAVRQVSYSNQQFFDDGGLKWCPLNEYQQLIDEVCDKDQLVRIKMEDIIFTESDKYKAELIKKLEEY